MEKYAEEIEDGPEDGQTCYAETVETQRACCATRPIQCRRAVLLMLKQDPDDVSAKSRLRGEG